MIASIIKSNYKFLCKSFLYGILTALAAHDLKAVQQWNVSQADNALRHWSEVASLHFIRQQ